MHRLWTVCFGILLVACASTVSLAQTVLNWQQVRDKFKAANPTLKAGELAVDESKAQEITAGLRPNPQFTLSADGLQVGPYQGRWLPVAGLMKVAGVSQLIERQHKRELRTDSAQQATQIAISQFADQGRNLLFNLRIAFVQILQQKAILALAQENLSYFDQVLKVSRDRLQAGDISQLDLKRLELQRVQYETDLQTAMVNLRTAKIQLLTLLNDRTPVAQFDVTGPYDFSDQIVSLDVFRKVALDTRPDLRAAMQSVEKAKTDHRLAWANGSADPTVAAWYSRNPSFNNPFDFNTLGASVSVPIRIFDKNQGEKARTLLDISRNERLHDAVEAQVFSDVDSAYVVLLSTVNLLTPYKDNYLEAATRVRDTVSFSYQHGGAALLEFLDAQRDYRAIQIAYINLIGSYLTAASQLNLAVGREVIQ